MRNILGYEGRKIVITGAASGMGEAAARLLAQLGAEVYALDVAEVKAPVAKSIRTDMKSRASIDTALALLPAEIYALFNCAGVPHLTEALLPRIGKGGAIASIASTAGMGWKGNLELVRKFLALEGFDAAEAWLKDSPELNADAYGFSKQCLIVYTMTRAGELAKRDIRINCISPSPTSTAFMDQLTQQVPADAIKLFCPSNGRFAEPAEMGEPLVLLNSRLAGFVSGLNLPVDYGYSAEVAMGQRDNLMGI